MKFVSMKLTQRVMCDCSQKMAMVSGYCLAVSVGGLDRQRLRGEQGSFLPAGDLALAA